MFVQIWTTLAKNQLHNSRYANEGASITLDSEWASEEEGRKLEGMWNISFMGPTFVVAVDIESHEETAVLWKPVVWELIPIKGRREKITYFSELPRGDPLIGGNASHHKQITPFP